MTVPKEPVFVMVMRVSWIVDRAIEAGGPFPWMAFDEAMGAIDAELARLRADNARLTAALEAADKLTVRIKAEGGHGYAVHDLAEAYDLARRSDVDRPKTLR